MYAFTKKIQFLEHTRRYSILTTDGGWEVREERFFRTSLLYFNKPVTQSHHCFDLFAGGAEFAAQAADVHVD